MSALSAAIESELATAEKERKAVYSKSNRSELVKLVKAALSKIDDSWVKRFQRDMFISFIMQQEEDGKIIEFALGNGHLFDALEMAVAHLRQNELDVPQRVKGFVAQIA